MRTKSAGLIRHETYRNIHPKMFARSGSYIVKILDKAVKLTITQDAFEDKKSEK